MALKTLIHGSFTLNGKNFEYFPIEISRLCLSVLVKRDQLNFGDFQILDSKLNFLCTRTHPDPNYKIFVFESQSPNENLENVLSNAPEYTPHRDAPPIPLRAVRFDTRNQLSVIIRPTNSHETYRMHTENVSKSGVLLVEDVGEKPHYELQGMIEITIDPDMAIFEKPLEIEGEIARLESLGQNDDMLKKHFRYGVRLINIDEETQKSWYNFIETVELERHTRANQVA